MIQIFADQILDIFENIHDAGLVHGDISPSNILLRSNMKDESLSLGIDGLQFFLVDFGVSINWADEFGKHVPENNATAQVLVLCSLFIAYSSAIKSFLSGTDF